MRGDREANAFGFFLRRTFAEALSLRADFHWCCRTVAEFAEIRS